MDLVRRDKEAVFDTKKQELEAAVPEIPITVFGTSIWDESLYRVCDAKCSIPDIIIC
jgi:Ras-related GTP-binding protein A/B